MECRDICKDGFGLTNKVDAGMYQKHYIKNSTNKNIGHCVYIDATLFQSHLYSFP